LCLIDKTPSVERLKDILKISGVRINKLFNANGIVYRDLSLKNKINPMTNYGKLLLLSPNGMLIKKTSYWVRILT